MKIYFHSIKVTLYLKKNIFSLYHLFLAICKSRNGESGNGMRGTWGMGVGMRGIWVEMRGIKVEMRGIDVGIWGIWMRMWRIGVEMRGVELKQKERNENL